MKTPNLLDVPKDSPSMKERLDAFKATHGIETHYTRQMKKFEQPWLAAHLPSAHKLGHGIQPGDGLVVCISKVGRLMDESGCMTTGETEREAIRELCQNLEIQLPLWV